MAQKQKGQTFTKDKNKAPQNAKTVNQPVPQQQAQAPQKMTPQYPTWPVSKPGPWSTPPPPGMRPINAIRREQVTEVGYNQETGTPSTLSPFRSMPDATQTGPTSPDQAQTAQEALQRRKRRL